MKPQLCFFLKKPSLFMCAYKCYDQCYAISSKLEVLAFKWYIIYENTFKFGKLMCKLLRKCHCFHIFTYTLIHKHAFTFVDVTQNCTTFKLHNTFFLKLDKIC